MDDKEKDFLEYLKEGLNEVNDRIRQLEDRKHILEMKLMTNKICPWCYQELKEEDIGLRFKDYEDCIEFYIESYCDKCGFSHQWIIE